MAKPPYVPRTGDYVSPPGPVRWAVVPLPDGSGWSWWVMANRERLGHGVEDTRQAALEAAAHAAGPPVDGALF